MNSSNDETHDRFLRLFTTNEPALRVFVRSLVPTTTDADDILQEVAITLWQKFDEFSHQSDENFRKWSFGVAKYKVLAWKRDLGRDRHVFTDRLTETLAIDADNRSDQLQAQHLALKRCMDKLPVDQKDLIDSAYAPGTQIDQLAKTLNRTAMSLYKQLHRIRMILAECTRKEMKQEDWS